jgi:hypothetical protein
MGPPSEDYLGRRLRGLGRCLVGLLLLAVEALDCATLPRLEVGAPLLCRVVYAAVGAAAGKDDGVAVLDGARRSQLGIQSLVALIQHPPRSCRLDTTPSCYSRQSLCTWCRGATCASSFRVRGGVHIAHLEEMVSVEVVV